MTNEQLSDIDGDLVSAMENNGVTLPSPVKLDDGQHAYITGGCDYTGWDCQSNCEAFVESTLEAALRQVPEAYRDELAAQVKA